ncbi:hypothetical protein A7K72_02650 [Candidatus Methylacidiphilum fumarolicum]|nr:hypothetical protein A7K72_02650 [Candidatus Methylacidiphilum fumarolicum]TFE76329.1 hypothetical protein A7D33_10345 [Candidatus Methylacidiphilum fumarolicum]
MTTERNRENGLRSKPRRIHKHNLGKKKRLSRLFKAETEIGRRVGLSLRQLLKLQRPSVIVSESLDFRGKALSKELSRRLLQMRSCVLQERIQLLAPGGGSRRELVNPAYSSLALSEVLLCPSKEPCRRQVYMSVLRVREPCRSDWRMQPQRERIGDPKNIVENPAVPIACDAFGEVFSQEREPTRLETR